MSIFWKSKCCCGGPCVHTDPFDQISTDFRWQDFGTDGTGGGGGYQTNFSLQAMEATGDGSLAMVVDAPTASAPSIFVEAELIDDGTQTESGVTIRRADSTENISLVRVWGTIDAYELREGTTVLEAFTATGTTTVKLEISDALSGTTDIKCYVQGVLVHTEPAVAFTLPEELDLGLICLGGGRWESVSFSPCPAQVCDDKGTCDKGGIRVPGTWQLDFSGVSDNPSGPGCTSDPSCDPDCGPHCETVNDSWTLLEEDKVRGLTGDLNDPWGFMFKVALDSLVDTTGYNQVTNLCQWFTVVESRSTQLPGNPPGSNVEPPPPGTFPVGAMTTCGFSGVWAGANGNLGVQSDAVVTAGLIDGFHDDTDTVDFKFVVATELGGIYATAWMPYDSFVDFSQAPVVLDLVNPNTACTGWPAQITATPNGSPEKAKYLLGCLETCDPPLDPGKLYQLITDDGTAANQACGATSAIFNEQTFSWEWTWVMVANFEAGDTIPHGCTGDINFEAKLTCYEKNEGEGKKWWLDFTGDVTGSIEWDVLNQDAGGLVNICGTADVAFAALASECTPEDHPLYSCVDDSIKGALCCLEGLVVDSDYTLVDPSTQPPECGVNDRLIAGFDGTGWLSPHPNEGARADGVDVRLTCSGGSIAVSEIVNGVETNCFISEQSQNPFVVKASGNHVGRCGSPPGTIWTLG